MQDSNILFSKLIQLKMIDDVGFLSIDDYRSGNCGMDVEILMRDAKSIVVYICRTDRILSEYGKWYVVSLNKYMKLTGTEIGNVLRSCDNRYQCLPICDEKHDVNFRGRFSYKKIAQLAGLGSIGKNQCVIHPRFGPIVNIGIVLTNIQLATTNGSNHDKICLSCGECIDSCPTKALTNTGIDRPKCKSRRHVIGMGCGMACLYSCPLGLEEQEGEAHYESERTK